MRISPNPNPNTCTCSLGHNSIQSKRRFKSARATPVSTSCPFLSVVRSTISSSIQVLSGPLCFSVTISRALVESVYWGAKPRVRKLMHAVDITNCLDERISELIKNKLPEEPVYPSGQTQYASFMMPRDEMNINEKSPEKSAISSSRSNGNRWEDDEKLKNGQVPNSKNRYILVTFWSVDCRSAAGSRLKDPGDT